MATTTAPTTHRWSRQEYHALADAGFLDEEDRVELIDGEIIHMSLQDTPHAVTVRLIRRALQQAFPEDDYMVDEQLPLALGLDSEPEPDVAWSRVNHETFLTVIPHRLLSLSKLPTRRSISTESRSNTCTFGTSCQSTGSST
jgi:Uma2 family endonuclease